MLLPFTPRYETFIDGSTKGGYGESTGHNQETTDAGSTSHSHRDRSLSHGSLVIGSYKLAG